MRKFILIAGFVLASASAHGADRSLSLSGVEKQSAPAPAKTIDVPRTAEAPQAAETPKYTERPTAERGRPMMRRTASMSRRGMRPHRPFRLARIIHTLHRYGIYW